MIILSHHLVSMTTESTKKYHFRFERMKGTNEVCIIEILPGNEQDTWWFVFPPFLSFLGCGFFINVGRFCSTISYEYATFILSQSFFNGVVTLMMPMAIPLWKRWESWMAYTDELCLFFQWKTDWVFSCLCSAFNVERKGIEWQNHGFLVRKHKLFVRIPEGVTDCFS